MTEKRKNAGGSQPLTKTNHQKQDSAEMKKSKYEQQMKPAKEAQKRGRTKPSNRHSLAKHQKAPLPKVSKAAAEGKEADPAQVPKSIWRTLILSKGEKQILPPQTTKIAESEENHQSPKAQLYMQRYQMRFSRRRTQGTKRIKEQTNAEKRFVKTKKVINAPGLKEQAKSWVTMTQPKPLTFLCTADRIKDGREVRRMQGATTANTLKTKTEGPGKA